MSQVFDFQSKDGKLRYQFSIDRSYDIEYVTIRVNTSPYSWSSSARQIVGDKIIWHTPQEDTFFRPTPEAKDFVERLVKHRVFL